MLGVLTKSCWFVARYGKSRSSCCLSVGVGVCLCELSGPEEMSHLFAQASERARARERERMQVYVQREARARVRMNCCEIIILFVCLFVLCEMARKDGGHCMGREIARDLIVRLESYSKYFLSNTFLLLSFLYTLSFRRKLVTPEENKRQSTYAGAAKASRDDGC